MMENTNGVSVFLYAKRPEMLPQCLRSLQTQRGVSVEIKLLADPDVQDCLEGLLPADSQLCVTPLKAESKPGKVIHSLLPSCAYDRILFVEDDSVFEGDAFSRLLTAMGTADGLVFNVCDIRPSLKYVSLYKRHQQSGNLYQEEWAVQENPAEPENPLEQEAVPVEEAFTLETVYAKGSSMWNQVFRKQLLLQAPVELDSFKDPCPYYYAVCYHSRCQSLACDTDLFVYKRDWQKKKTPGMRFCLTHGSAIRGMLHACKSCMPASAYVRLKTDFTIRWKRIRRFLRDRLKAARS